MVTSQSNHQNQIPNSTQAANHPGLVNPIMTKRHRVPPILVMIALSLSSLYAPTTRAYNPIIPSPGTGTTTTNNAAGRRAFLQVTAASAAAAILSPKRAAAAAPARQVDVYFGVGCFWHSQHEFVNAERTLLGRKDGELTSRTGYAGGKKTDKDGRVCYHNFQGLADYGKLGHGEVVGMKIPESSIGDFAEAYFAQFTAKGERVDPQDRGAEYRSLLGLPGGSDHPRYPEVEAAATAKGLTLVKGGGNDPDTLGKRIVYCYDSDKFPFYQAEVYHQFHDDFLTPPYGKQYNDLVKLAYDDGRVKDTGCPDRIPM